MLSRAKLSCANLYFYGISYLADIDFDSYLHLRRTIIIHLPEFSSIEASSGWGRYRLILPNLLNEKGNLLWVA